MHTSKNAYVRQLARRVFCALKESDPETFETDFDHAYKVAAEQSRLSPSRADELCTQVKQASKAQLEEYARKAEKKSLLPNYFKLRRPILQIAS